MTNILFLQPTKSLSEFRSYGSLGMTFYFYNTSYSLIHQLKHQGIISHLAFSLVDNHYFIFGGIPHSSIINKTHSYCNVIDPKR